MKEIYRSTDPVEVALLTSVFESAGIRLFTFDNTLAMDLGYSPCRFMVLDEDYDDACDILDDCGLEPPYE
jgi:hypothetical protein